MSVVNLEEVINVVNDKKPNIEFFYYFILNIEKENINVEKK
ncbi:hypothetical protein [Clostridium botulinum]